MNMPQDVSTALRDPSTQAVVWLVDTTGGDGPASPREVLAHLQAGAFFWLDLEDPGDDELAEFSQSLQIPAGTIVSLVQPGARSSFAPDAARRAAAFRPSLSARRPDEGERQGHP
jgi:Mg2+ and Co2+ transporter CorA